MCVSFSLLSSCFFLPLSLIHSSNDRQLNYFHIFAIQNNVTMSIGGQIMSQEPISQDNVLGVPLNIHIEVELLDPVVALAVNYLRNLYSFPQWLHQFTFPLTEKSCFVFPFPSDTACSNRCEAKYSIILILISLVIIFTYSGPLEVLL